MRIETQAVGASVMMTVTDPTDSALAVARYLDRTMGGGVVVTERDGQLDVMVGDSHLGRVQDISRWLRTADEVLANNPQILASHAPATPEPEAPAHAGPVADRAPQARPSADEIKRQRRQARIEAAERELESARASLARAGQYTRPAYEQRIADLEAELADLRAADEAEVGGAPAASFRCPRCGETDPARFRSGQRPGTAVCDDCAA